MKILIWIIVPSAIAYAFYVTYNIFKKSAPEEGSREDEELREEFNH